jgi:16S rRNA (cytosine1402-N4)-methyltransferase
LNSHVSVLLDRVLDALGDAGGKSIVDATFGAGGYSGAFLDRGATVIAFDRDPSVAPFADRLKKKYGGKFRFVNDNFSNIAGLRETCDAVVFDFGVSSMQIDGPSRGFSWRFDAPLDMRMNQSSGDSAAALINRSTAGDLARILREYGDAPRAAAIAMAIKEKMPGTTFELRDLIYRPRDIAPVFQALRIAVNDELGEIERALAAVPDLLNPGGICACVTFHSLEARLVKSVFRKWTGAKGDPRLPESEKPAFRQIRAVKPGADEIRDNPRARSAQLRVAIKAG